MRFRCPNVIAEMQLKEELGAIMAAFLYFIYYDCIE